ncbi:MAG TPA: BTAD domain-containing putative transcriptional regulator [Streptosporangiaceae bacterium]
MTDSRTQRKVGVLGRLGVYPAQRLSGAGRRVLAYMAVKGPVVLRSLTCMNLWPSLPEDRARANLRRTLWQLSPGWVVASSWELRLMAEVDLDDAHEIAALATTSTPLEPRQVELLKRDLLPGWYEEWLVPEQDQFHLQRIQALEKVCRVATEAQDFGLATSAGLAAVCAEPLRESAVTALVAAHLGEGNRYEAVRRYHEYASVLRRELDVEPGAELAALMSPFAAAEPKSRLVRG